MEVADAGRGIAAELEVEADEAAELEVADADADEVAAALELEEVAEAHGEEAVYVAETHGEEAVAVLQAGAVEAPEAGGLGEAPAEAPTAEPAEPGEPAAAADPFEGMSAPELFWLATECLAQQDVSGAVEACDAGRRVVADDPDLVALHAWARSQRGGADLKALAVDLDEVLGAHEGHVEARYYRGMMRKRLGDRAGSVRDLQRVVELSPGHEEACRELAAINKGGGPHTPASAIEEKPPQKLRPSLFGKLFKR